MSGSGGARSEVAPIIDRLASVARRAQLLRAHAGTLAAAGSRKGDRIAKFCLYCTGRTGSELLLELLRSHPAVVCDSEILAGVHPTTRLLLRGKASQAARAGAEAYGFKLVNEHLRWVHPAGDWEGCIEQMTADGFRFIRLRRRNLLRQALSHLRAEASGVYRGHHRVPAEPLHIDPLDLIFKTRHLEVWEEVSDGLLEHADTLDLWYEDDLHDPNGRADTMSRLFKWIGVQPDAGTPVLIAPPPSDLGAQIANLDEVRRHLAGTRFESMLD